MKTFLLFAVLLLSIGIVSYSQTLPAGFVSSNATPGAVWTQPVGALFSKDGTKLFVWEKAGKVFVCNRNASGNYIKQNAAVLDISQEVANYNDYGLTGFALDPQFESNGLIYLSYVVDRHHLMNFGTPSYNSSVNEENAATIGRITRYTTTMSGADLVAAFDRILLGETRQTGVPILHLSHGTGSLVFAADGTLLASMGDGASFIGNDVGPGGNSYYVQGLSDGIIRQDENVGALRSQMLTSLSGKLLRLNPQNGDGIASNPFFDINAPRSAKSRIWSIGLRNPFRISIKPGQGSTNPSEGHIGEVFIGDVGFGTWEELNIVKEPGMNFGWPLFEGHNPETYVFINTENKEVPIPPSIVCGTRQFMRFRELIRQDNAAKDASVYYPCSSTLYSSDLHHIHARPALDWIHANESYNPPNANARVGIFNSNGEADVASIGSPASGATGNVFNGNSSTGGIWYTGTTANTFPVEYQNSFYLADYGEKWIKRLTITNTDKVTKVDDFATNVGTIVCLTENPMDGSLVYVTVGDGSPASSAVRKISFGGNMPPVAKIKGNNHFSASSSLNVAFDGTDSYDQDGTIVEYSWNFDDPTHNNNTSLNPTPHHDFFTDGPVHAPKKYTVKLTVKDDDGATGTDEFIVSINNTPPVVNITSPVKNSKYKVGTDTTYLCRATVSDAQHNASQLTYEWQSILVHNNHTHPEPTDPNLETSTTIERIGCTGENYHWLIKLTVTDPAGLSTTDTSQIYPNCSGALPIFLHKFSVTQNGSANVIKWTTEIESHIEYFELERSTDGISFSPIFKQDARNTPGPNVYSFDDKGFLPGFNYYRLKIVEQGNVIRYSVVIKTVSDNEQMILKVVPNPVVGNFSLTYQSPEKDRVTIQIRDVTGRLLHTQKVEVNKGLNVVYMQNLPNWNSGVYFVSVQNKNDVKQAKFIKAR